MAKTVVVGDRSLHAKSVVVDADTDRSLLVSFRSNAGKRMTRRMVRRQDPEGMPCVWHDWNIVLSPGDDAVTVRVDSDTVRWPVVAFVVVGDDGEPVVQDDGTGRTARELAAAWLGCDIDVIDALLVKP